MQHPPTTQVVQPPPPRPGSPSPVIVSVRPKIITHNANIQKSESLLALLVGIAIGVAGALAAMKRDQH